jgi:hypothetical protein
MESCASHSSAIYDLHYARALARQILRDVSPETVAEVINGLDQRETICCPAAGYVRSLMKTAFRGLLQGEG